MFLFVFRFLARFAVVAVVGRVLGRLANHPRVAPVTQSRRGRLALLLLGFGLRRNRRTRTAGHVLRHISRRSRGLV